MTLFQFWYNLDTPIPIALIFYKEDEYENGWQYNLDQSWTWEGTPEELYSEYGYKMYGYEIIEIQREDSGYTIWITDKEE